MKRSAPGALVALLAWTAGCDEATPAIAMDSSELTDANGRVVDLVCPGARGCEASVGRLSAGAALRSITPAVETWEDGDGDGVRGPGESFDDLDDDGEWDPVWLAGFDPGRAATGVHDDTWARALSLQRGDLRVGIVVLDLLGFGHDDVLRLREAAAEAGLDIDQILVLTTHTHQSKDPLGFGGRDLVTTGYDPDYIDFVIEQAVGALSDAAVAEVPVSLAVGRAEAPALVSDSRLPLVIDQSLYVLAFTGADGAVATWVIWGNHAESLGGLNTLVSSDYPHYLREAIEAAHPGTVALFSPGALGGLTNPMGAVGCPDASGAETCPTGTFEKAAYIGEGAAAAALEGLRAPLVVSAEPELAVRRHGLFLTVTNATIALGYQIGVFPRTLFDPDGVPLPHRVAERLTLEEISGGAARAQTEVNLLTLGPLALLALPGEIYPELWIARDDGSSYVEKPEGADFPEAEIPTPLATVIEENAPASSSAPAIAVVLNQANDGMGYIIPQAQFDEVAPHAYDAEGQYGEGSSMGYETAGEIDAAVRALLELEAR